MRINTRVDGGRTCNYSKSGVAPTYFQHGVCGGHTRGVRYTQNGSTTWRFVLPGASGTANLVWTGNYTIQ